MYLILVFIGNFFKSRHFHVRRHWHEFNVAIHTYSSQNSNFISVFVWSAWKLNFARVTGIYKAHFYKTGAFLLLRLYWFWRGGGWRKACRLKCKRNKAHIGYLFLLKIQQQHYFIIDYGIFISWLKNLFIPSEDTFDILTKAQNYSRKL